jgi:single-stranded-DNA-specific exonuclease
MRPHRSFSPPARIGTPASSASSPAASRNVTTGHPASSRSRTASARGRAVRSAASRSAEGKIGALREFLAARIEAAIGAETPTAQLTIDGAIAPLGATSELLALIEQLAPFGAGNPEPRFAIPAARILFAEPVGGAHVRCTIADAAGAGRLKAIAFRSLENPLGAALLDRGGALLHLAGHLRADSWNGRTGVQFMIDDAAPVGPP